jgi:hypothetical protein
MIIRVQVIDEGGQVLYYRDHDAKANSVPCFGPLDMGNGWGLFGYKIEPIVDRIPVQGERVRRSLMEENRKSSSA